MSLTPQEILGICLDLAAGSSCPKAKFGAVLMLDEVLVVAAGFNKPIPETQFMCPVLGTCIRENIPSRTQSLVGGCCHAEEHALFQALRRGTFTDAQLHRCTMYVAGMKADGQVIQTTGQYTCLRCATSMALGGIAKVAWWDEARKFFRHASMHLAVEQAFEFYTGTKSVV